MLPCSARRTALALFLPFAFAASLLSGAPPAIQQIIEQSVKANQLDFATSPDFNHQEKDRDASGSKTFKVIMIDGSPYQQSIAVNGKPLSTEDQHEQERKLEDVRKERAAESTEHRQERIAKYNKGRNRDNAMMDQLTKAFNFTLVGERKIGAFNTYLLRATPRPGYQPPNLECQVLPSMQGQLWIDKVSSQWVKVTATVTRPASIEGFLAQVEPGTQFELEKMPVGNGVWQPKHFSMRSKAKVLFLFSNNSQEDDTFSDYTPAH